MRTICLTITIAACVSACATTGTVPGRADVGEELRARTGKDLRDEPEGALPPGVTLAALTREDAVAVALWNSPAFEASLTDLGLARADLVEARLLRNPILSLLFPIGPKQLEWTLQLPVNVLWERPRRVAAAMSNARAVGERLVYEGLTLVADVRTGFAEAVAGERRVTLAAANAELTRRIAGIADARLRAGDISELEARTARSDAAQVDAELRALQHARELAALTLIARMGVDTPPAQVKLISGAVAAAAPCESPEALVEDAVSSRPDVRAAEIAVEAAGQRLSWERTRIANFIALLDTNGPQGVAGVEMGPGFTSDIPVFSRNQGFRDRAAAELDRAGRMYLAVRAQVAAEVRSAAVRLAQAQQVREIWTKEIVPSLEVEQRQAESAYKAGEVALLTILDVNRRLVQARLRQLEVELDLDRAAIALDRSVGRACASV
ncbi:MAG: TolC family protein [Vicinamibacterales bacterium]